MSVAIHQGSILDCKVDAIVNPANSFMRHSGGLAAVIDRAAQVVPTSAQTGKRDEEALASVSRYRAFSPGLVPTGAAVLGPPGVLPFKAIIHAVGPIWGGGIYCEEELLFSAYRESFRRAFDTGYNSIAVPAISAGIFGVPIRRVAWCAISACESAAIPLGLDVVIALMDDSHVAAFRAMGDQYGVL